MELQKPTWMKTSESELKKIIAELMQKEKQPAKIGLILRDQYMKEQGYKETIDLKNAEEKVDKLKEHLKDNITDRKSKHKLQTAQSRFNVIRRYYGVDIRASRKK